MHIYGISAAATVAAFQFIHHALSNLDKLQSRIVQKNCVQMQKNSVEFLIFLS